MQSISIGKKNILAGLKNGDVYELSLFTDEEATNAGKKFNFREETREIED